jgi:hypothetical protein
MLKRLTALFAILVLLLPGSLAAVVFDSTEVCMGKGVTAGCCCEPAAETTVPGPIFKRGCCCTFDAPVSLPSTPDPERSESQVDFDINFACAQEISSIQPVLAQLVVSPRPMPRLRAPPTALFLKYSRFLC